MRKNKTPNTELCGTPAFADSRRFLIERLTIQDNSLAFVMKK